MSIDLEALGRIVRQMQAEIRSIRSENTLVHHAIVDLGLAIGNRIAQFEATFEARLDQTERSIEERFGHIDERLTRIEQLLKDKP